MVMQDSLAAPGDAKKHKELLAELFRQVLQENLE